MFPTVRYDSEANRFAPHTDYLDFEGFDWPDADLKLQIRDSKNGGAIRVDLAKVASAASEGVRIDSVTTVDGVTTTRIAWRINETTLEAISAEALGLEPDADVNLFFDLHVTPVGELKFVPVEGTFTVKAGVTE